MDEFAWKKSPISASPTTQNRPLKSESPAQNHQASFPFPLYISINLYIFCHPLTCLSLVSSIGAVENLPIISSHWETRLPIVVYSHISQNFRYLNSLFFVYYDFSLMGIGFYSYILYLTSCFLFFFPLYLWQFNDNLLYEPHRFCCFLVVVLN